VRPAIRVLTILAGVTACVAAALPWIRIEGGRQGFEVGFFSYAPAQYWFSEDLLWGSDRPPVFLLVTMASIGAVATTLAAVNKSLRWLVAPLLAAPVLAVVLSAGTPLEWPWDEPAYRPHMAPGVGYWVATASLALSIIALTLMLVAVVQQRRIEHSSAVAVPAA
jgi:hypothetical protein